MKSSLYYVVGFVAVLLSIHIAATASTEPYDPWMDLNDDGLIDSEDLQLLASIYSSSGEPINKTERLLELEARVDSLNATLLTEYYNMIQSHAEFVDAAGDTMAGDFDVDSGTLHVDSVSNRVGIGTSSPITLLDVRSPTTGSTYFKGIHYGYNNDDGGAWISSLNPSYGAYAGGAYYHNAGFWTAKSTSASSVVLNSGNVIFYADTGLTDNADYIPTERMRITNNGNVGIGTTNPGTDRLKVAGSTEITGKLTAGSIEESTMKGAGRNLWPKSSFETGRAPITGGSNKAHGRTTAHRRTGNYSYRVCGPGGSGYADLDFGIIEDLKANNTYIVSAYVLAEPGIVGQVRVNTHSPEGKVLAGETSTSHEWERFSYTFTPTSDVSAETEILTFTVKLNADGCIFIDDILLSEGSVLTEYYSDQNEIFGDLAITGTCYGDALGIGTTSPEGPIEVFTTSGEQLDQQNTLWEYGNYGPDQWQSFTAGKTGVLTKIDWYIQLSHSYSGTIYIREGEGGSGTILSSNPVSLGDGWSTVDIADVNVTVGQKYTIQLTGWSNCLDHFGNPYPGGRGWYDPNQDLVFRTYVLQSGRFIIEEFTGNVGIGTTNPTTNLDVAGDATIRGTLNAGSITMDTVERYYSMSAPAWLPNSDSYDWSRSESAVTTSTAGTTYWFAPVNLPHGAVVTEFRAWVWDDNSTDIDVDLRRQGGGLPTDIMATVSSSGSSPSFRNFDTASISHSTVDNQNYTYCISARLRSGDSSHRLSHVRITYTISEPLP